MGEINNWDEEIRQLEIFFQDKELPKEINFGFWKIKNVKSFIDTHLSYVKRNNGNSTYLSYLERLTQIKNLLK